MRIDHVSLAGYLRTVGIDAEVMLHGRKTPTVAAAAQALGVRPDQIIKTLLFENWRGERVLVVTRGAARVDERKLARASGLRGLELAPAERVQLVTGYPAGAVPPVGHATRVRVLLDRRVLEEPVVYGGGGRIDAMLRISPEDIRRLTDAETVDVAEEPGG